jgi:hypothetical protein
MPRPVVLVAAAAVGVLAVAGAAAGWYLADRHDSSPAAATGQSPSVTTTSASRPTPPADPALVVACRLANGYADVTDDAPDFLVAAQIATSGQRSADSNFRFRAGLLGERVKLARAAQGQPDQVAMTLQLYTGVIEFATECTRAHFAP